MIHIAQTVIKTTPQKKVMTVLTHIYGIGSSRARPLVIKLSGRSDTSMFFLKRPHFQALSQQIVRKKFLLNTYLRELKKNNLKRLKFMQCYRGKRHLAHLPTRGQRTKSNAMTQRYLSSGSYEYIPTSPSTKIKRLSKYIRRKSHLKLASELEYKRLLNKNFLLFAKQNARLTKYLARQGKLGLFGKLAVAKKSTKKTKKK